MSSDRERLWEHVRQALSASNYDAPGTYSDFRKELVITTCVHGPRAELHFEAKIPRASTNELGGTIGWYPESREEIVAFLRELADLIATRSEGVDV